MIKAGLFSDIKNFFLIQTQLCNTRFFSTLIMAYLAVTHLKIYSLFFIWVLALGERGGAVTQKPFSDLSKGFWCITSNHDVL